MADASAHRENKEPLKTLEQVQDVLGVKFRNPDLLRLALTHASHSEDRHRSNERLEFLGDAILAAVVCETLYRKYPDLLEGELTRIKSAVVSRRTCAAVAKKLGLERFVLLGKGIAAQASLPRSVLADAIESLIGAVFLDRGYAAARRFVVRHFMPFIRQLAQSREDQNYKSLLQQYAQKHLGLQPGYVVVDEQGPDHAKRFLVAVQLGSRRFPARWGQSKKEAEQQAARAALVELGQVEPESGDDGSR